MVPYSQLHYIVSGDGVCPIVEGITGAFDIVPNAVVGVIILKCPYARFQISTLAYRTLVCRTMAAGRRGTDVGIV
jgi:hypothetical protein